MIDTLYTQACTDVAATDRQVLACGKLPLILINQLLKNLYVKHKSDRPQAITNHHADSMVTIVAQEVYYRL